MAGGERRLAVSVTWWRQVVWTNWDLGADQHIAIRYCQNFSGYWNPNHAFDCTKRSFDLSIAKAKPRSTQALLTPQHPRMPLVDLIWIALLALELH